VGVTGWSEVPSLGRLNLLRLRQIAQEVNNRAFGQGDDHESLRERVRAIQYLNELVGMSARKPCLPRLRMEVFQVGDEVAIYLGDTPGALVKRWVPATVTAVSKRHKPEWSDHASRGYYWRVTATTDAMVFPGVTELAFSTTEPRVLTLTELATLRHNRGTVFRQVFCENARRAWHPIWCLERGVESLGAALNYESILD